MVEKVRQANYAQEFESVYGPSALADPVKAYNRIADAIAAFEKSPGFTPFTSKYDYYLKGQVKLTAQESRGRELYEAGDKGNCAACHPSRPSNGGLQRPLFTDFTYDNIGVPPNPDNPFYRLGPGLNPQGYGFVDLGLGRSTGDPAQNGKFKVSTLRNVAVTAPYTHNGYFKTLRGVVDFYNSRDNKPRCKNAFTPEKQALREGCWPAPEVAANLNRDELGRLGLSNQDVNDIVAFLKTLTDGYKP